MTHTRPKGNRRPSQFGLLVSVWGIALLFTLLAGCSVTDRSVHSGFHPSAVWERKQALDLYHEAWQVVFTDYLDPTFNGQNWYTWKDRYNPVIRTHDDAYVAIHTMLASLNDAYSRFLEPEDAREQNMNIDARLFGVGIQIALQDSQLVVVAPLDNSPAKRAGIVALDRIVQINGEPTANLSMEEAVDRIRGPKGTPVTLTFMRQNQRMQVRLVRDEIVIKTVFGKPVSRDIGYIRLSSFMSQDTPAELTAQLKAQSNKKALILDIRGNNGGLLSNALEVSQMFLGKGEIVLVRDRSGQAKRFYANTKNRYSHPLVLLVDSGSASASEILAGALQDHHRATLVGSQTFGKGLVQKINTLSDGSELNLTMSKYLTPEGHDIHHKGITPDIPVEMTVADMQQQRDPQRDAAIRFLKKTYPTLSTAI
jgi:carboxyl-terminal processing protease